MKKFINWLKEISKNPLVQKFYLIAFIAFCAYLVIPKWQIYKQTDHGPIALNKFTGQTRDDSINIENMERENRALWYENKSLKEQLAKIQNNTPETK